MTVESAGLVRSDYDEYGYKQMCSSGFTWKITSFRKWLPQILYYFEVGFQKNDKLGFALKLFRVWMVLRSFEALTSKPSIWSLERHSYSS